MIEELINIATIVIAIVAIGFFPLVILGYFILRRGNVKVNLFRHVSDNYAKFEGVYGASLDEKEGKMTIYRGLFGSIKIDDFDFSKANPDGTYDIIQKGETYIAARSKYNGENIELDPVIDAGRKVILMNRIAKNYDRTMALRKDNQQTITSIGMFIVACLLVIGALFIMTSNIGPAFDKATKSIDGLSAALNDYTYVEKVKLGLATANSTASTPGNAQSPFTGQTPK